MTQSLDDLRTAQEYLKHLDSIEDKLERTRYMAFILATETSQALEPLLGQLQEAEVALGQAQAEREKARLEERAKWLPLLEAINKFDSYFDFDSPIEDNDDYGDLIEINEARVKLVEAIQLIRAAEAGQERQGE